MELLRVIKKTLISLLLINVVIIGVCIFQIQNEIDDTDKLYTSLIEAYNEDENIDVQEYLKQSDEQMLHKDSMLHIVISVHIRIIN